MQLELGVVKPQNKSNDHVPLAERMRPSTLDAFVGQEHVVGEGTLLRQAILSDQLRSLILWGPPGSGKTTLATVISHMTHCHFEKFSAVLTSITDIKKVMETSRKLLRQTNQRMIVFIDEIHRFNKSQQDAFLSYVEDGSIILIGATTENPSFEIISPLLSRSKVFVLNALSEVQLIAILKRALMDDSLLKTKPMQITDDALEAIVHFSNGDARFALNTLELLITNFPENSKIVFDSTFVTKSMGKIVSYYDKDREEHYNIISALHKSMRNSDPDASLYWLFRMLEGGEDPLFIVRRLIRFASEDIGNADPQALILAIAVKENIHFIGMPESDTALAQLVIYLATAPKSNSAYLAAQKVKQDIRQGKIYPVPLHLRNAPTKLMKELNYGKNYQYAHNFENQKTDMKCLPDELEGTKYYIPKNVVREST